jgi:hypothetical protein
MPTPQEKLEKLKSLFKLVDESVSKADFEKFFALIVKILSEIKKRNEDGMAAMIKRFSDMAQKIDGDKTTELSEMKKRVMSYCDSELEKMTGEHKREMEKIDAKVASLKDGKDSDPVTVAQIASKLTQEALKPLLPTIEQIEQDLPKLGEKIRDGLELLKDEDRLDVSAIKGLEDLIKKEKQVVRVGGGGYSKIAADSHDINWTVIGTGDGTTTEFTLTYAPDPILSLEIKVGNADMFVTDDFTYSSSTRKITFLTDSTPADGAKIRQKCKI